MTVVKQLPDQCELEASQTAGPPLKEEASQRPILWQAEDMVIDEDCDTSFETLSDRAAKQKERQPLGRIGTDGSLDPASQVLPPALGAAVPDVDTHDNEERRNLGRTFTYSVGPDQLDNNEVNADLTDAERLRLAAVSLSATCRLSAANVCWLSQESHNVFTMVTQSLSRIPTICNDGPAQETAGQPDLQNDGLESFLETDGILPRSTALARQDSSIAFSSVFGEKGLSVDDQADDMLEEVLQEARQRKVSSDNDQVGAVRAQTSPILDFSRVEKSRMPMVNPVVNEATDSTKSAGPDDHNAVEPEGPHDDGETPVVEPTRSAEIVVSQKQGDKAASSNERNVPTAPTVDNDAASSVGDISEEGDLDCDCGNNDTG